MASDDSRDADDTTAPAADSGAETALWSKHDGDEARARVEDAADSVHASSAPADDTRASDADHASANANGARDKANDVREKAAAKANDAREKAGTKAAAFAASARERAAHTDVKEWAANTTSLIDTARPFFLAAFAVVFTILGFVGGDSGTSQWYVGGAILFVLAAGFSDELGHLLPRRRRDGDE